MTSRQRKRPGHGRTRAASVEKRSSVPDSATTHRRQAKPPGFCDGGVLQLLIMTPVDIIAAEDHLPLLLGVERWWKDRHHALCLCCDRQIKPDEQPPLFVFLRAAHHEDDPLNGFVSVICLPCTCRADLIERVKAAVQEICPGAKEIALPHPPPGRVQ